MKLSEVQVREKVPTIGPAETTARLRAEPGTSPAMGWDLDYEAGMVTARKNDVELLIPVGNVAYMRKQLVEPAKKGKAA